MSSLHKCSTPPKTIEGLIDCSEFWLVHNYGNTLERPGLLTVYRKIRHFLNVISKKLKQEYEKKGMAVLRKLEAEKKNKVSLQNKAMVKLQELQELETGVANAIDNTNKKIVVSGRASSRASGSGGKKKRKSRRHKKKKQHKTKKKYT